MINRTDRIYKEIEEFKDYELTNCIAFEMAVRNKEFQKNYKELVCKYTEQVIHYQGLDYKQNLFIALADFGLENKKLINKKLSSFKLNYTDFINLERRKLLHNNRLKEEKISILYKNRGRFFTDEDIDKNNIFLAGDNDDSIEKHLFLPSTRPIMTFENMKNINISINLELSKDELIHLICEIKNKYDSGMFNFKSNAELLSKKNHKYKKAKNVPKNKDKRFTMQQKWADWFFIYDYYTKEKEENEYKYDKVVFEEIDQQLLDYYDDGGVNKDGTMEYWKKSDVYRKTIIPTMKELIEDMKYKSLITGE